VSELEYPRALLAPAAPAWPPCIGGINHAPTTAGVWSPIGKDVRAMASCSEMKAGEVYVCADCGLEIQVLKSCADSEEGACSCSEPLSCCGESLTLKR